MRRDLRKKKWLSASCMVANVQRATHPAVSPPFGLLAVPPGPVRPLGGNGVGGRGPSNDGKFKIVKPLAQLTPGVT